MIENDEKQKRNMRMNAESTDGTRRGSVTLRNVLAVPAPSVYAAFYGVSGSSAHAFVIRRNAIGKLR